MKIDYIKDIFENFYKQIEFDTRNNELSDTVKAIIYSVEHSPLTIGHAHYIVDYYIKDVIYHKGIKELLGYDKHEFGVNTIASYTHPDDYNRYAFIVKSVIDYFAVNTTVPFDAMFSITARLRKKDGSYINVLRNTSLIEVNEHSKMTKTYSLLSDVTNIKASNQVTWNITSRNTSTSELEKFVKERHKNYFSPRETEILHYLNEGLVSKQIAEKLFVSKHTVDTHRRKMLTKSTCTNTIELLDFARNNSII